MSTVHLPSLLLENAVKEFSRLPGIGRKTALRLVLHLMKQDESSVERFGDAIVQMRKHIHFCKNCYNVSDTEICAICSNPLRNKRQICVVENIRDVIAVENTGQFSGTYHVLGGVISPLDGVGPEDLTIEGLLRRVVDEAVEELVFALSPNIQGDTTIYFIQKKLQHIPCRITTIARGISFGGELEFADELTLGRSLANRMPIENYMK